MENLKTEVTSTPVTKSKTSKPYIVYSLRLLYYLADCNLLKYLFKVEPDRKFPTKNIYHFKPVPAVGDAIEDFKFYTKQEREERESKLNPVIEIENNKGEK